jgi:hypothetical protein
MNRQDRLDGGSLVGARQQRHAEEAMIGSATAPSHGTLEASLMQRFVEGDIWPVGRAALVALGDMGMSDMRIAAYFSIEPIEVVALRHRYRLGR